MREREKKMRAKKGVTIDARRNCQPTTVLPTGEEKKIWRRKKGK